MTDRILRIAAVVVALATAVLCVGAVALRTFGPVSTQSFNIGSPVDFAAAAAASATYAVVGVLVAIRLPRHPVPWIFIAVGATSAMVVFTWAYVITATSSDPPMAGAQLAALINTAILQPIGLALAALLLFVFPDGRAIDRTYRRLAALLAVSALAFGVGIALTPGAIGIFAGLQNPLAEGAPPLLGRALTLAGLAGTVALGAAGCRSLVLRYRAATVVVREQIRWFAWAASLAVTLIGVVLLLVNVDPAMLTGTTGTILVVLFFGVGSLVPIACAIGILRYRLYDIDRLISGTFVYGCLVALAAGIYSAGMAAFERISIALTGGQSDLSIVLTTLVLAVSLEPMKRRLERLAERFKEAPPTGIAPPRETLAVPVGRPPIPDDAWIELVAARVLEELRSNGADATAAGSTDEMAEPAEARSAAGD